MFPVGYDSPECKSGAWTNQFLTNGLQKEMPNSIDLVDLFDRSYLEYQKTYHNQGDWPCMFATWKGQKWNTDEFKTKTIPKKTFYSNDWL